MNENNKEVIIGDSIKINGEENNNDKVIEKNRLKLIPLKNDSMNNNIKITIPLKEAQENSNDQSKANNNTNYQISENNSNEEIDLNSSYFPYCIVWTPIPCITYLFPSIGHSGIGTSRGIIHDFAGSYYIGVDNFAFGKPTKYIKLKLSEQEKYNWDKAIEKGDNKYKMEKHNIFTNNCHSHVAFILNQLNYKGKTNYTMINIWWMLIIKGKYVSFCGFFKTYIGFLIIILVLIIIVIIIILIKK